MIKGADLQGYMNFKGRNLPDLLIKDFRGIKGLLRETGSPKEINEAQKLPPPLMNDLKRLNLERIYGKIPGPSALEEIPKKRRDKLPPEFRIRKNRNGSGSDSGGDSPREPPKSQNKETGLPPIQVKNKNENFMFNINFIVNNQKDLPSPRFQRSAYKEDFAQSN